MAHQKIDVAQEPTQPLFKPANLDVEDYGDMDIAGPGGKVTNIENNEKGILETGLFRKMSHHTSAALGSDHDAYAQGIYTSHGNDRYED